MLDAWIPRLRAAVEACAEVLVVDPSPPPAGCVYASVPKLLLAVRGSHPMGLDVGGRIRRRRLPPHGLAYVRPGGWHRQERGRARVYASLSLHPDYLRLHLREHDGRGRVSGPSDDRQRPLPADPVFAPAAAALAAAAAQGPGASVLELARVCWRRALAAFAERPDPAAGAHDDPNWLRVRAHIDTHVHQPLSRATVAAACGLHPSTLSELARRATGRRFIDVLTAARMRHAAHLIVDHDLGVAATAEALGFCDVRHFRRVFTRTFGHPPSRLRPRGSRPAIGSDA